MREMYILIILLVILLSGCAQAPQPLPLTQTDRFIDLTERMEWTISYPAGWTSSLPRWSDRGWGGRWIREDAIGLTSASLTFTTVNGAYTSRTILAPLLDALRENYADIKVVAVNDLPKPIQGTQAVEVYLSAVHAGTRVLVAWVVETQDLSQYSMWPITAVQIWAIEVPEGQVRQKLPTLLAILGSARIGVGPQESKVGETWYGEIAERWMKNLG